VDKPLALFRCDASPKIGAGHVTRCLALSEALAAAGWRVIFAVGSETSKTAPALFASGFEFRECDSPPGVQPAILGEYVDGNADLLVIDHYQLDATFERACRLWAKCILVLDDETGRRHDCDILADAGAPDGSCYAPYVTDATRIYVGPQYALIRQAFVGRREAALKRRDGRAVRDIFVSFGATDAQDAITRSLEVLKELPTSVTLTIALSRSVLKLDELRQHCDTRTRLLFDISDLSQIMTDADLAIGAAGATAFERAVVGLPSAIVTLADNQRNICQRLVEQGAAVDIGRLDINFPSRLSSLLHELVVDGTRRVRMAQAASNLVDGRGPIRLAQVCK